MSAFGKVKTTAIYRFFGSKTFFQLSMFLILLGTAWFIFFTFVDRTDDQKAILDQLVTNNHQVEELKTEVGKLRSNVCVLQNQIESLGAKPAIQRAEDCINTLE